MPNARVVRITDLPPCEPNISQARVLAAGPVVVVVYEAQGADWPNSDSWAVVRFDHCLSYQGGGPNDEALHNHPLYAAGLKWYTLQEVLNSPWIPSQAAIRDKSADPIRLSADRRHFVFALKEDTFECIAKRYSVVGVFESYDAAFAAASTSVRSRSG